MGKSLIVAKFALATLDSIMRIQPVDIQLSLTDFGLMAVFAQDFFEKLHDIARHGHHPLRMTVK
jgi:hypothetical protein